MSELVLCRTCGEKIYNLNAKHLFELGNNEIVDKIQKLTGISIHDDQSMPRHICACCHLDLNHSIAFRERCIRTQNILLNGKIPETNSDPLNTSQVDISKNINKSSQKYKNVTEENHNLSDESALPKPEPTKRNICADAPSKGQYNRNKGIIISIRSQEKQLVCSKETGDTNANVASTKLPTNSAAVTKRTRILLADSNGAKKKRKHEKRWQNKSKARLVCEQCGRTFADSSNLKVHMVRHTGVKSFECEECGAKYFTQHLLNLHIRVRHKGEMPYACKYCGLRFFTSTARCRHERVKHIKQLSYECRLCGKSYLTKSCLNKHEYLHTGERPHRCEICDIGFPRNTNLKIHYRSKQHKKRAAEMLENNLDMNEIQEEIKLEDSNFENIDV